MFPQFRNSLVSQDAVPGQLEDDVVMVEDPPPRDWGPSIAITRLAQGFSGWIFGPSSTSSAELALSNDGLQKHTAPSRASQLFASNTFPPPTTPSFVERLPPELLQEIFDLYTQEDSEFATVPLTGSYERVVTAPLATTSPMHLTHVCSSWRRIAASTSSLWSKLTVYKAVSQDLPLLNLWLSRASAVPLDLIFVSGAEVDDPTAKPLIHVALKRLMHESKRWRRVDFRLGKATERSFQAAQLNRAELPKLEEYQLNLWDWSPEAEQRILDWLASNSRSTTARIIGFCELSEIRPMLRSTSLRRITLGSVRMDAALFSFPAMQRVHTLTIEELLPGTLSTDEASSESRTIITLPRLSSLSLGYYTDISVILPYLRLPSLKSLNLESGIGRTASLSEGWEVLNDFFQRSDCSLVSLGWYQSRGDEEELLSAVKGAHASIFSDLERLKIITMTTSATIRDLTVHPDRLLLPSLRYLELSYCLADQQDIKALVSSRPTLTELRYDSDSGRYVLRPLLSTSHACI